MADLFDGYPLGQQWDEMFAAPGQPRAPYTGLFSSLQPMSGEELAARADVLSQTYRDAGVTFAHAGEEQPFPLDIVPRVIGHEEWAVIERGVAQRVLALEAFLADVYGAGQVFSDGVVPRRVVTASARFHRAAHGLVPPNGVRVHVSGIDLVRGEAGDFRVLEDNLRSPYVVRMRTLLPEQTRSRPSTSSTPMDRASRACSKYAELCTPGVSTTTVGSSAVSGAAACSAASSRWG